MNCRQRAYHWILGVAFTLLDVGKTLVTTDYSRAGADGGLPSMTPEQVRSTVAGLRRRADANERDLAEELLASHAPPSPRAAILAHPTASCATGWPPSSLAGKSSAKEASTDSHEPPTPDTRGPPR